MELSIIKEKFTNIFKKKNNNEQSSFSVNDYITSDNDDLDENNEYQEVVQKEQNLIDKYNINYHYNKIIFDLSDKFNENSLNNIGISEYLDEDYQINNPVLCEKIEKYLKKYFKSKRIFARLFNRYPLNINKLYKYLNYNISKIERLYGPIFSYDRFINCGINAYNYEQSKIESKKETIKKEKKKKEIITTPELEELKTNRRKLLNKVRKMEKVLKETREQLSDIKENQILSINQKLLRDKETLLETENMMYDTKINDDTFKGQIENNKKIRREKSEISLQTYFRRKNNGKIKNVI